MREREQILGKKLCAYLLPGQKCNQMLRSKISFWVKRWPKCEHKYITYTHKNLKKLRKKSFQKQHSLHFMTQAVILKYVQYYIIICCCFYLTNSRFTVLNTCESQQNLKKLETVDVWNFNLNNGRSVFNVQVIYVLSIKDFSSTRV